MRRWMIVAALLLCLPMVGEGQSIRQYPAPNSTSVTRAASGTAVATSGTAAEVLASHSLPAGYLSVGDALRIKAWYTTAANGNTKAGSIRLGGIGGDACYGRSAADNNQTVQIECTIFVTGAATQKSYGTVAYSTTHIVSSATMTQNTAAALDVVFVGTTASGAGDMSLQGWYVEALMP